MDSLALKSPRKTAAQSELGYSMGISPISKHPALNGYVVRCHPDVAKARKDFKSGVKINGFLLEVSVRCDTEIATKATSYLILIR